MQMDETIRSAILVGLGGVVFKGIELALKRAFSPPPSALPGYINLVDQLQEENATLRKRVSRLEAMLIEQKGDVS